VKLIQPAKTLAPGDIGLAAAVGFYGGVFPVPAVSTGATLAMCYGPLRARYNPAMLSITLVFNAIATPFQLLLMPTFMNLPYNCVNIPKVKETIKLYLPDWMTKMTENIESCNVADFVEAVKVKPISEVVIKFGSSMVWASFAWASLAPFAILSSRFLVSRSISAFKKPPTQPPII
jgi:hypothetical protein